MAKPAPSYRNRHSRGFLYEGINARIAESGRWIVYVRADRRIPCLCFDPNAGGASECTDCFGLGYRVSIERIKVGFTYSQGLTPGNLDSDIGDQNIFPAVATMRAESFPAYLDLIFEVDWSVPSSAVGVCGTPVRLLSGWKVRKIIPMYTESAETEFFGVGLEEYDLKHAAIETFLRGAGSRITTSAILEDMTPGQNSPIAWTPGGAGLGDRYTQFSSPDAYRSITGRGLGRVSRQPRPGL